MNQPMKRRRFLAGMSLGTLALAGVAPQVWSQNGGVPPSRKLNLGVIGVANRGGENLRAVAFENIVALCDVDKNNLSLAAQRFPNAKTFQDFRELLEVEGLDAVVISTPDHCHAVIAAAALNKGLPIYCEKPLARTVSEARRITELARQKRKVTQLGTQIHASRNYRRVVELVQSGVIGAVREVHVWVQVVYGGVKMPTEFPPVPPSLNYDLWLGPLEFRPYSPEWVPFKWRNWWAFGGGTLADFGCHYMDLPHWALELSHPRAVEVLEGPPVDAESVPTWLKVRYEHPARGNKPPVTLYWYQGQGRYPERLTPEQYRQWRSGVLFVGEEGQIIANYTNHELWPEQKFANFQRPKPFIKDSPGHHAEWLEAIRNGGTPTCHFDYAGPLTETALLGNVAYRAQKKLEWNWRELRAANAPEADKFVQHRYRAGWKI
ncbi:MAG: Gfo/Idh/MocA family oxidoreductase [Verrucomicrobiae bacterium]|nr:Gfo/Idh/MocA family oxidoreductase [Verrucomicrobiae bacterium]